MSHLTAFVSLAALAVATSAAAAPTHLSDVQYMQAARCQALIASPALGGGDTSQIDALLKTQARGRIDFVADKADEMRRDAARAARSAGPSQRLDLVAERDGVCEAYNGRAPGGLASASSAGR